ncbi:ATP-binding protein [bacterium]|nr:ATP-binding protein [bacterium]
MGSYLAGSIADALEGRGVDDSGMVPRDWALDHLEIDQAGRVVADGELVAYARRHSIGIPRSLEHATFSSFQALTEAQKAPARRVRDWVDDYTPGRRKNSLALIGLTGTGKTHLAIASAKKMVSFGLSPRFVDYRKLLIDLTGGGWDADPVGDWAGVDLLIIDDFGAAKPTATQGERLAAILALRMNELAPTIITTNDSFRIDKLTGRISSSEKYIDDRLISRLTYNFQFVAMGQIEDWRALKR